MQKIGLWLAAAFTAAIALLAAVNWQALMAPTQVRPTPPAHPDTRQ